MPVGRLLAPVGSQLPWLAILSGGRQARPNALRSFVPLLRPRVNRGEDRLIYIRQSSQGANATFSMPEIGDLRSRVKTLNSFGDFSTLGFARVGLGEPRSVQAGVVGGSYFQVMGLRPVLGRLLDARPATVVGVLEPCVPYPQDTEIIANVVTSAHHLSATMVYRPFDQEAAIGGGHLFVHARSDPYSLVMPITRIMRTMSADQPVERAATLEDIRAEVLSPERLNVMVSGVFAGVALLIAVVGVAGVLAFSASGRTREFGIRLAVGSQPRHLLMRVMAEGAAMAIGGLAVGLACGYWLGQLAPVRLFCCCLQP